MISKELLSEVLDKDIFEYRHAGFGTFTDKRYLVADYMKGVDIFTETINIYELAHKCKEWAWDQGYILHTYKSQTSGWLTDLHYMDKENISDEEFGEDGFIQIFNQWIKNENSDFKACEWILENMIKDNK